MQFPLPLFSDDKSDVINNKDRGFISGQFIKYYLGFFIFFSQIFPSMRLTLLFTNYPCDGSMSSLKLVLIQKSQSSSAVVRREKREERVVGVGSVRLENK